MRTKMNSKMKILIGVLVVGIVFIGGWLILKQIITEPVKKQAEDGEIVGDLQITIEPVDAAMEEYGVYIFRKNEPFKIKVTLENKGNKDLNLLTPDEQTVYDKVFYFQILDVNGTVLETDTRLISMLSTAAIGPERILLQPGGKHSFFAYINSDEYGIEHHHFVTNIVRKFPDIGFDEKYYKIKGIYDTTGYRSRKNYKNINEILLYSNDIMIEIIE